jgi:Carboxypeptidase regulatory-like domain/TonB-dependent Receptor Plug Domain/TonB dependent receptor
MRSVRFLLLLVLSVSLFHSSAWTQSATATILGRVTDPQGAAIAKAHVTVTNTATQVAHKTESDAEGNYRVSALPIGTYEVTAEHEGFAKLVTAPRTLQINQEERMDLRLVVGAKTETVEVTGVGSNVETLNPTIGASVTSRPIVDMPLNGRDVLDLALLQPGVSEDNPDDTGSGHFNIGGGRADSVTFLLDGGLNNDLMGNNVVFDPNPDTIAEFRILTSNYTAEYGRNGAGIITEVIKSGTNQYHGSAFDFVRNTDFDANSYFNNEDGLARNNLKRHQFGGTFGGPITIPRLINGKDRFFFFVGYQGQRQTLSVVSPTTAFTTAELNNGDFSQAPDASTIAAFLLANPYFQPNASLAAQAMIDTSKYDPATKAYIATGLVPSTTNPSNFLVEQGTQTNNNNEFTGKFDFNIGAKDKLAITIGGIRNPTIDPFGEGANTVTGFPVEYKANNYYLNIGYTRTFSPTLLNEFHAIAQRHNDTHDVPTLNLPTGAAMGFGILSDLPNGPPSMFFDNGLTFGDDPSGPAFLLGTTYAFSDALTWVRGRHTWKAGAGFSAYQNNTVYDFYGDGQFEFVGPYSEGGIGSGDSLADFLIGIPNNFFEAANAANNLRSKAVYGFLQDEWRVTKNFTLSLGMRYEYSTPKLDTQGRTFSIVPGAQSTRFPLAPLGLVFPGDQGAPRGVNFPDKDNFAPRFGFAWDPSGKGKMSIRGGVGIFYDVLKGEDNLQFNGAPPYYSEQSAYYSPEKKYKKNGPGPPYFAEPWTSGGFLGNPFPSVPPTAETAFNTTTGNSLPFGGLGIYFVDPHLHTPYTYQYNLSVEKELARDVVAQVNYVGSSSKKLTSLVDVNPFILSSVIAGNPTRGLNVLQNANLTSFCSNFFEGPADCPFENADAFGNVSFASFNSLEASVTKDNGKNRYIGNTYFTLGYTYAHSIDNSSGFRNRSSQVPAYDPGVFRSSSDFDLTHRVVFSGGWDLPFDDAWSAGPKRLTRGWSLYPIFSWRTGFPLTISSQLLDSFDPGDPGPSGAGDGYLANAVFANGYNNIQLLNPKNSQGTCTNPNTGSQQTGNLYFNCAAFTSIPDVYVPGQTGYGLPRNFFRGPHRTNLDLTLAKTTTITERLKAEIRVDAFNLLNEVEFNNPDTNIFSSTFGQITNTDIATPAALYHTERQLQLALRLSF